MAAGDMMGATRKLEVARLEVANISPDVPLDAYFRRVCELSANAIDVERVGIWLFIDNDTVLRCVNLYERSKNESSSGAILRPEDFKSYFSSLKLRKAVPAEIAVNEPWTSELAAAYLRPLGISSMLDGGIFLEQKLIGVVCHEHVGPPREWSTEVRDFVGSLADLVALRIQSAKLREISSAFLTQQERLATLDKISALEQMAAGVAHDFRNLLHIISSYAEILGSRDDLPDDAQDCCHEIASATIKGISLANDLMSFAKPGHKPPMAHDIVALTVELLPLLKSAVRNRCQLELEREGNTAGQVLLEKSQYLRILMNLVINSAEATPKAGRIIIRLKSVKLTGNASYTGRYAMVEVIDQGCGIAKSVQPKIFDPYFTTKTNGTGLGLATVRQFVERMGGLIRIESNSGQGTTIRLLFPSIGTSSGDTSVFEVPPELKQPE